MVKRYGKPQLMAARIIQIGNDILRQRGKAVERVDAREIQDIVSKLIQVMREQELVGIAAPQMGYGVRIFVTEIRATSLRPNLAEHDDLRVFINPKILKLSRQTVIIYEGCGSVAHGQLLGPVKRPKQVMVRALDKVLLPSERA